MVTGNNKNCCTKQQSQETATVTKVRLGFRIQVQPSGDSVNSVGKGNEYQPDRQSGVKTLSLPSCGEGKYSTNEIEWKKYIHVFKTC